MWKTLLVIFGFLAISIVIGVVAREKVQRDLSAPVAYPTEVITPSPTDSPITASEVDSLFVPYWTLHQNVSSHYDRYLYFGITPTSTGIDTSEQGSISLPVFLQQIPEGKKKILTIRMIDSKKNFAILKNKKAQSAVISESLKIAQQYGFDGILLDLEVSAAPFDSLINQITAFTSRFAKETKKQQLSFTITIYGDVFYRIRPFAVKALAQQSDGVMVMAYDFSKARGNPGPNFPLQGKEVYGYDMTEMVADFLKVVPASKLTVVFGLYGYDWEVNDKEVAISHGEAITYSEITEKFFGNCSFADCIVRRKNDSAEIKIRYTDDAGKKHIVWFEDPESVAKKKRFLKQKGITSFAFWANGYF